MAIPRKKKGILGERMMQIILSVNQVIAKTGPMEDAADVIYTVTRQHLVPRTWVYRTGYYRDLTLPQVIHHIKSGKASWKDLRFNSYYASWRVFDKWD